MRFRNLAEVDEAIYQRIEREVFDRILPALRLRFAGKARFEPIYEYPAHAIAADHPLVVTMKHIVGRNDHSKVAFGAEAGLFLRELGLPTVLCGRARSRWPTAPTNMSSAASCSSATA